MAPQKLSASAAYKALGIAEDSPLETVKTAYKKLALSTHPDKNPGNADATVQFQEVSEAYNVLVKHLDRSARPTRDHPSSGPFGFHGYDENDEYYDYSSDEYHEQDYSDDEMDFYMFIFEEMMRGRGANRYSQTRFHHDHRPEPESQEQYQERLRRSREIQIAGEERRAREEAERKIRLEKEREQEKREAEARQKAKKSKKKGQAEASRKHAETAAQSLQRRAQELRSVTFSAARAGDVANVKKGVYEDDVDAAGGEIKQGCEEFVTLSPEDPKETLMHIAVKSNDFKLVNWLDAHSAEPDERDSGGLTPFHTAVLHGTTNIMKSPFFENYPPKDPEHLAIYTAPESTSLVLLAIESGEPEALWMIHEHGLTTAQDIESAWTLVSSPDWKEMAMGKATAAGVKKDAQKLGEIRQLLMSFGGFTPPPTPKSEAEDSSRTSHTTQTSTMPPPRTSSHSTGEPNSNGSSRGKTRGRGRGRGRSRGK